MTINRSSTGRDHQDLGALPLHHGSPHRNLDPVKRAGQIITMKTCLSAAVTPTLDQHWLNIVRNVSDVSLALNEIIMSAGKFHLPHLFLLN